MARPCQGLTLGRRLGSATRKKAKGTWLMEATAMEALRRGYYCLQRLSG